jgi:hypothetical protein
MVLLMALPGAAMTLPFSAALAGSARKLEKLLAVSEAGSTLVTATTVGQAAGR